MSEEQSTVSRFVKYTTNIKISPHPFGKTVGFIFSMITAIVGLIIFSYFVQNDNCFLYNDWRRQFTMVGLTVLLFGSFIYALPHIEELWKKYDKNNCTLFALVFTSIFILMIPILMFYKVFTLVSMSQTDFEAGNPKQKLYGIIISGILVFGSTIPFMNYVSSSILTPVSTNIDLF